MSIMEKKQRKAGKKTHRIVREIFQKNKKTEKGEY